MLKGIPELSVKAYTDEELYTLDIDCEPDNYVRVHLTLARLVDERDRALDRLKGHGRDPKGYPMQDEQIELRRAWLDAGDDEREAGAQGSRSDVHDHGIGLRCVRRVLSASGWRRAVHVLRRHPRGAASRAPGRTG